MPVRAPARGTDPTTILTTVRLSSRLQAEIPAGWTGLEPAASGVTGRRYNQLNYHPSGDVLRSLRLFSFSSLSAYRFRRSVTPSSSLLLFVFVGGTGLEPATAGL